MEPWPILLSRLNSHKQNLTDQLNIWLKADHSLPLALIQDDQFIGANPAALAYFQAQVDSFIHASPSDFSPRIQSSGRSSVEYTRQMIEQALQGEITEFNWQYISQKGDDLPTKVTLFPFKFGLQDVLVVQFESKNRRSHTRPRLSNGFDTLPKELMSTILEDNAEAVYITDAAHQIIAVNKAMCRICEYSTEQLLNSSTDLINIYNRPNEEREFISALQERGSWQGEVWKQRSDGSTFPAWKSCRKISTQDKLYYVTIFSDISSKKELETQLTEQAMYDTLTGLPNRFHLIKLLNQAIKQTRAHPDTLGAVMFLDLNGFKNINDCFGHATGDKVLQLVSARLEASCIENADIARLGGDEFTLIVQKCNNRAEVEELSKQIMSLFDTPFEIDDQKLYLGTSIGIALFPEHSEQANKLLSLADTAMYSAKISPTHLRFYDKKMHQEAEQKLHTLSELRHAHNLDQFKLAYQAIVDLECHSVIGAEALLRWHRPDGEIIDASDFVPLLEETGLLISIGQWVLELACTQMVQWRKDNPELKVCVNVSPMQLEHHDFVQQVTQVLNQSKLPAEALMLEITELALLRQPEAVTQTLLALKKLGVSIAIDDFGAGLSSLSKLSNLPIDCLKIDAGFAQRLSEPQGKELCQAMIQLAQALDISFVIEGIETQQQKDILEQMGKGFGQGYFFGHPKDASQFMSDNL
ncbi:GGDEF domain-containing protein [Shewanella hanedai]|uniref:EAL domain-containing protein n=1 Tax=Shewanella hanedai TaxID=25 RepID=A0A553JIS3_SHEHA|nr:EAL domain-containing protein [Shewanella hanedai]TRY12350.1 EAL domain-containing protein [Shewanella hanedai]GGI97452.1 GGDEF domain-containing protein [Shewanella hanedai]